ncbi:MAG: hypothetical protein JNN08_24835 [Bryobacterales bacterium]|nr:hypothetical protein [Bryobacterales bacterium]
MRRFAPQGADAVYRLLGVEGLAAALFPAVGKPVHGRIGYHLRTSKHGVTLYDWEQFLNFADRAFRPSARALKPARKAPGVRSAAE